MPTVRRRHAITETEEISHALDVARHAWPDLADKPGALLRRLILAGEEVLTAKARDTSRGRRDAIERTSATLTGVYGPAYLADLAEVMVGAIRAGRGDQVRNALDVRTGLKWPDCCVLHAARIQPAAQGATFDARLAAGAAALGIPVVSG